MRWFWSSTKEKEPEGTQERLDRIEKDMRRLEEEWTDVYAKFRTMQMRVAKQVQRLDANSSPQEEPQNGESVDNRPLTVGGSGLTLSPRQRQMQQQIMARRARIASGGE